MSICAQVTNEFLFGEFSWALKVRPQVLLTWSQDEPGLNMSLTRRPRNQSQGRTGRTDGRGWLIRLI